MMRQEVYRAGPRVHTSVTKLLPIVPAPSRATESDTSLAMRRGAFIRSFVVPQSWAVRVDQLRQPQSALEGVPSLSSRTDIKLEYEPSIVLVSKRRQEMTSKSSEYKLDAVRQTPISETSVDDDGNIEVQLRIGGQDNGPTDIRCSFEDFALTAVHVNDCRVWWSPNEKPDDQRSTRY